MCPNQEEVPVLIAHEGPLNGKRWLVERDLTIGRDSDCQVAIPSRQVSRFHAKITVIEDGVFVEDLSSKNGTHRNGVPIASLIQLFDGDVIQVALAQSFVYLSADATIPLEFDADNAIYEASRKLRIEKKSRRIWIGDTELIPPLSASQFKLLELLYEYKGRVVPRSLVAESVWGKENSIGVSEQALDALVRRLRDRISRIDPAHNYVITVRGHGLRLDNPHK